MKNYNTIAVTFEALMYEIQRQTRNVRLESLTVPNDFGFDDHPDVQLAREENAFDDALVIRRLNTYGKTNA